MSCCIRLFSRSGSWCGAAADSNLSGSCRSAGQWLAALIVSLFVLNAGYLFRGTGQPLNSHPFASDTSGDDCYAGARSRSAECVGSRALRDYVTGFDRQRSIMEVLHPVYLDEELWVGGGFRDYYFWTGCVQMAVC